jgi:Sulfotransferase family
VGDTILNQKNCKFDEICAFNRRGLFLGGAAKSGTTLLLSLLDGHPKLVVLPEQTHFLDKLPNFSSLKSSAAKARWLVAESNLRLLGQGRVETHGETKASIRDYTGFDYSGFVRLADEFANEPRLNDSLIFSEVVRAYAIAKGSDWQNCIRWVEKTPGNEIRADELFKLYPEARLLQVVRDPRAVFASRKTRLIKTFGHHTKAHRLVREWNESSRQIRKLEKRTDNYLLVRYEDIVQNTTRTLEKISQFIGIELLPVMLEPTRAGSRWEGNSSYQEKFAGISAESVNQWKNVLTEHEIWWIEMHCREGMQIAGYQLETDCKFSLARWSRRMAGESWGGYLRARRGSLCQLAGLLEECKYDAVTDAARS